MRRNLLIGLCLTAVVAWAAGDYVFNRSVGAQDAPKKAEPDEKKGDLFELLKKGLDEKKKPTLPDDLPAPQVNLPMLPGAPAPSGVAQAPSPAPLPPVGYQPPLAPLPLPAGKVEDPKLVTQQQAPAVPAPMPIMPAKTPDPLPPVVVAPTPAPLPLPKGKAEEPNPIAPQGPIPAPTPNVSAKTADPLLPPASLPLTQPPAVEPVLPPIKTPNAVNGESRPVPRIPNSPTGAGIMPATGTDDVSTPRTNVLPPANPAPPIPPPFGGAVSGSDASAPGASAKSEPAKTKISPWSLHIEIVDDMTIVTATVNKKHEFKVVCQNLEVQTSKNAFKASGKVKITGDSINGSCERLAISLTDDRLVLEGGAEVQIQKAATQVSSDDGKPAAFELKGETLDLRISELRSGKFIETSWRQTRVDFRGENADQKQLKASFVPGSKDWSPYGKLRRADDNWVLENDAGKTILRLEISSGKSLNAYNGRWISVFGTMTDRETVHVTHIAVP